MNSTRHKKVIPYFSGNLEFDSLHNKFWQEDNMFGYHFQQKQINATHLSTQTYEQIYKQPQITSKKHNKKS